MSPILLSALFLIIGFVILITGADLLVSGATSFARRMRVSELAIGLSVVAFGTSAPELVVNVISNLEDHSGVVFGNIIGSNIFNLTVILGAAGLIYPMTVKSSTKWKEIPISFLGLVLVFVLGNDRLLGLGGQDSITPIDGLILLVFFCGFLYYVYRSMHAGVDMGLTLDAVNLISRPRTVIYIILGIGGLVLGGKFVVDSAVDLATYFDMSEKMIGLTIVAAGTSLPELATSAVAAFKKRTDIAIGNIIGSNIFNIFFVLGITALIRPLSYEESTNIDLAVTGGLTLLLFVTLFIGQKNLLNRFMAGVLLLAFVLYMSWLAGLMEWVS